ncbi:NAD(P)H-quinone oxidoreductase [Rufibacter psychrotolerans]|uniref:NAD(P)H-quinone oxidoreductase n=1 Tax=Rufibacter psychrotolerans TaxID=2812556 RepID=UPI001968272F|nr:NAD(P)H-quinone oxidoreductase [Rufibacter sp. SYSU D00308]
MKAVVITQPGPPQVLQVQERALPQPAAGQVLIKVEAAGINRPDVAQRKGHYPPPAGAPADIPGLEIAGTVEACGAQVERWQPGDRVCALLPGGGYAEYAVVDARHCLPVPEGWRFEEAASLPETVFTVWHNVFQRGQLHPGETLLVHGGSSGIGITAIQLAKAWGARVFATAGSPEKCQACEALGAERCLNYKTEDFEEALKTEGVDVILDMVGGDYIAKNLNLLRPDGRLVFINAMHGAKGEFNALQVMQKRLTITGSTLRPRDATFKASLTAEVEKHVWPLLRAGAFKPVLYRTFALAEAAQAHELMESSQHIGKLVLRVGEPA